MKDERIWKMIGKVDTFMRIKKWHTKIEPLGKVPIVNRSVAAGWRPCPRVTADGRKKKGEPITCPVHAFKQNKANSSRLGFGGKKRPKKKVQAQPKQKEKERHVPLACHLNEVRAGPSVGLHGG